MTEACCIPNLTPDLYRAGSRYQTDVPELIRSEVDKDGSFDFEWTAAGSNGNTYDVTASGKLDVNTTASQRWKGMNVHCTCPSFEDQDLATTDSGWRVLYVCKHLKAALDSVCDDNASGDNGSSQKVAAQQDGDVNSSERARLEHGLSKRSNDEIVQLIHERIKTKDGLKGLAMLFPPSVMPEQQTKHCSRCGKDYDPQIPSDQICCKVHPEDQVNKYWESSKKRYTHCEACDKTFNVVGFGYGYEDEGPYCFKYGRHLPEEPLVSSTSNKRRRK